MQCLQHPIQSNIDNLNNVICKASRHFRNKEEYLKLKSINLKLTVRHKISEICIGASMTSKRSYRLELI